MPKARRGELWLADLGMIAKVRPVLILSGSYLADERAVARLSPVPQPRVEPGMKYPTRRAVWSQALSTRKESARSRT
jgi:mRNA-degrading endonuclease toxin of MazEF toxin-antitoxin module